MSITYINSRAQAIRERLRDAMRHLSESDVKSPEVGVLSDMARQLNDAGQLSLEQLAAALKFFEMRDSAGLKKFLLEAANKAEQRKGGVPVSVLEKQEEVTAKILSTLSEPLDVTGLGRHGIDEPTGLLMEEQAIEKFESDDKNRKLLDEIEAAILRTVGWDVEAKDGKTEPPYELEYDLQIFEDEMRRPYGVLVAEFTWENSEKLSLPYESMIRVSTVQHIELPLERDILEHDKKLVKERKAKGMAPEPSKDTPAFPPELLEKMRRERSQ